MQRSVLFFLIDEDQRVTLKDIGTKDEIINWANRCGAKVTQLDLESQFRCNGSDGYLAWVDDLLQIRSTANETYEGFDYDFQVMDNPFMMHKRIMELNEKDNKSENAAGYCWKWISKQNKEVYDFIIGEYKAQ